MEIVFSKLVNISLMANWLILAVVILRLLLKKAPRQIICVLWAIVAFRLLFPISIESPVSMIPEATSVIQEAVDTNLIHPEIIPFDTPQTLEPEGNNPTFTNIRQRTSMIPIVWCTGAATMLCYLAISYIKMRHLVVEAVPETEQIWICDAVTTPFILGIVRSRIYLPSGLSGANREYVIAHEQSHLNWKDHWWKPLAFVLLAIYWFDPFVWIAYALVCRDIEFACDERVIHHYGIAEKKAYSAALLECSTNRRLVLACPVAFGETAVVQRVRNVLNYKRPHFWIILISVLVIMITAIGFLTVPVKGIAPDPQKPVSVQVEQKTLPTIAQEETLPNDIGVWDNYPDGVQIDTYKGETFTAQIMIVRDPSKVYMATSSDHLSKETPGVYIDEAMYSENAIASINAGYFYDDGTTSTAVGSIPCGLVLSENEVVWDSLYEMVPESNFAGFNKDNILIVASSMTEDEAAKLQIRDGCTSGPVLMINGKPNMDVYNKNSGYTQRAAIGQRSDGAVVFVCTDGRNADSLGATYSDVIDILKEHEVVNACALMSGSSSNMLYLDMYGRYAEKGTLQMLNSQLRKLPTFWMIKPAG